jgi:hypothetical protein
MSSVLHKFLNFLSGEKQANEIENHNPNLSRFIFDIVFLYNVCYKSVFPAKTYRNKLRILVNPNAVTRLTYNMKKGIHWALSQFTRIFKETLTQEIRL